MNVEDCRGCFRKVVQFVLVRLINLFFILSKYRLVIHDNGLVEVSAKLYLT